jgi:hypothetical protein
MIIDQLPIDKWLSLPVSSEVRQQILKQKIDDILVECDKPVNDEERFRFIAQALNQFIILYGLDMPYQMDFEIIGLQGELNKINLT